VHVKSAGVNPVDTRIRTGGHVIKPSLPYTPGNDGAGIVESIGDQVTKFKVNIVLVYFIIQDNSLNYLVHTESL